MAVRVCSPARRPGLHTPSVGHQADKTREPCRTCSHAGALYETEQPPMTHAVGADREPLTVTFTDRIPAAENRNHQSQAEALNQTSMGERRASVQAAGASVP